MAERWAVAAGSIDTPANWNGGTLPTSADDVYLNGLAMTAAAGADIAWLSLRATAGTTAIAGGSLTISAARNFNFGTLITHTSQTNGTVIITATTGTVSITATVQHNATTGSTSFGISKTGACNFTFNGGISASGTPCTAISVTGAGTLSFGTVGSPLSLVAASGNNLIVINHASAGGTIYANQFLGGAGGSALVLTAHNGITTFGPAYGGSASGRFGISSASTTAGVVHTHNGDCYGGTGGSTPAGISKSGNSTLTVNGNAITNATYGVSNAISAVGGVFNFTGDVQTGPSTTIAISGTTTYTMNIGAMTRSTNANVTQISNSTTGSGTASISTSEVAGSAGTSATVLSFSGASGTHAVTCPSFTGGGIAGANGISCSMTGGSLTVNGDVIGGEFNTSNGLIVTGAGATVTVNGKAIGNGYGVGGTATGPAAGLSVTALATVSVREVVSGPRGQSAIIGPVLMLPSASNKATFRQSVAGPTTDLVPGGASSTQTATGFFV